MGGQVERNGTCVNILETEDDFKIEVAAPGMTKEDFKVHINEENELVISMEKRNEHKDEDKKHKYLPAARVFVQPVPAEPDSSRQCREGEDRGFGRERRADGRDPEEEGDRDGACIPTDRDQIMRTHLASKTGENLSERGFSLFFCLWTQNFAADVLSLGPVPDRVRPRGRMHFRGRIAYEVGLFIPCYINAVYPPGGAGDL